MQVGAEVCRLWLKILVDGGPGDVVLVVDLPLKEVGDRWR